MVAKVSEGRGSFTWVNTGVATLFLASPPAESSLELDTQSKNIGGTGL